MARLGMDTRHWDEAAPLGRARERVEGGVVPADELARVEERANELAEALLDVPPKHVEGKHRELADDVIRDYSTRPRRDPRNLRRT